MGSRAPQVLDAILSRVRAAAPADVRVFDGPMVDGDPADAIHIGYNADPEATAQAVRATSAWAGLGAKKRDETIVVTGAIYLLNGAADVAAARVRGYALLAVVESAIHPDPAMGLPSPTRAGVTDSELIYVPVEETGLEVWLGFTITVQTRTT